MNELAIKGRNRLIRVFASVLLISINTIVTYNLAMDSVETKKIVQQIIRFGLTALLMYFIFKGKKWAVTVLTILCSIAILLSFVSLLGPLPLVGKIPLVIMIIIYSVTVLHLNFSKSFREYFNYLNTKS